MEIPSHFKLLLEESEIQSAVKRLGKEISEDYKGKSPLLIGVLKGTFIFMADLIRHLTIEIKLDFIELSRYGKKTESDREVREIKGLESNISERDVLIIEDIIDTGITITSLIKKLKKKGPASIGLCALTDKPFRRKINVEIDYIGFKVPNKFIVGYGLDFKEKYRHLRDIYYIDKSMDS
jgi:hypoxanthine phosphoribosyltransferase